MKLFQNNKWRRRVVAIASGLLVLCINTSYAATTTATTTPASNPVPTTPEQIEFTIEPSFPKPGGDVNITLEAYGTDLNSATISWSVDGKIAKSGKGEKSFSLKAGNEGSVTRIETIIGTAEGKIVKKQFFINPQTVDILWEARTYTPPFYKGKTMYTPQERVVFVAMPNLTTVNSAVIGPKQTTYKWSKDNTILGSLSGYGKSAYVYSGSVLSIPVSVTVEASAESGQAARNNITLSPTGAEAAFYEESPSLGILFNREISTGLNMSGSREKNIAVFPYFFGVLGRSDPKLSYTWTMNGSRLDVEKGQSVMTFRNEKNEEGVATIGIIINNDQSFLQGAIGGTVINFSSSGNVTTL